MFLHVTRAEYLAGHRLHVWFSDGTDGEVDLHGLLTGPVFSALRDPALFRQFEVAGNTVVWSNGADLAPEYLHRLARGSGPVGSDRGSSQVTLGTK